MRAVLFCDCVGVRMRSDTRDGLPTRMQKAGSPPFPLASYHVVGYNS